MLASLDVIVKDACVDRRQNYGYSYILNVNCFHRVLARLLSTSNDAIVLSVTASDIGQYVKRDPSSKK